MCYQALMYSPLDLIESFSFPNNDDSTLFPLYFVSDEAFALKLNIMRPYSCRHLTNAVHTHTHARTHTHTNTPFQWNENHLDLHLEY
jgi:hypothetical protein